MQALLWIFVGGGTGCICRYAVSSHLKSFEVLPWGTFAANIIACTVLGAIIGYEQKLGIAPSAMLLLATGFCGGFSTFSTFSLETLQLLQGGHVFEAGMYVLGSTVMGLAAVFFAYKLMYLLL